jgi:glutaredoxin
MNKIILIIRGVIAIAGLFWAWQYGIFSNSATPVSIPDGIILFYGEDCPHCKIVDDFVNENKIKDKIQFSHLEVWYNKDNQNILTQVVIKCGISANQVGVPFLWDGEKCYIGDVDIINFFKNATEI